MTFYIFLVILAAALQAGIVYFLRNSFVESFVYTMPFILISQGLFLYSYANAPNFLIMWFVTTAITNILALCVGYFLLHERLHGANLIGLVLIIIGIVLLKIK
jgi:multidrug transporter EmrE-like cation transporter